MGGKITAYRAVARDAADLVCRKMGVKAPCITSEKLLPGAPAPGKEELDLLAKHGGLSVDAVNNLAGIYGSRTRDVLNLANADPRGGQPISPSGPDIIAQIWHASNSESCMTVGDFMLRRSMVGLRKDQGMDAVNVVAREMKNILGWNSAEETRQIEAYKSVAELGKRFRNP